MPRFVALSAGYTAVLELPFEKRQLFNVLHSVSAGGEMQEGVVRLEDYARRGGSGRKLRVLVADDNPTNREVIGKILERGGHSATVVPDGEDALDALEQANYDIVLLDRNMPRMGGIEALQAIRLMGRGLERIPVIVLSADVTPEARRECLEHGADAFLAKPIEALRLLSAIEELVEKGVGAPLAAMARTEHQVGPDSQTEAGLFALNHETLGHLEELGSGREFVERLFGIFLSDNVVLLKKIETSLVARDPVEFRNHLHAMKGSAASLGADRLTRLCTAIGRLSDNELKLQSAGLVKSISEEFAAVRAAAEVYIRDKMKSSG
jgi:two-component system sensor histidine kinase RpfC